MAKKELDDLKKFKRDEVAQINTFMEDGESTSYIFYYSDEGYLRVHCFGHGRNKAKYSFSDKLLVFSAFFCIFTAGYLLGGM